MRQRLSLLSLLALTTLMAWAGPVDLEVARGKAAKFMNERNYGARLQSDTPAYAPSRQLRGGTPTTSDAPAYYVFNAEANAGYVVISGDDRTDDILAYSTDGTFDYENMPSNVKAWMQGYTEQIAMLDGCVMQPNQQTRTTSYTWEAVAPMISTRWNQGPPYNSTCPMDNGQRSVTGCSATAMAQVMKYHEWPQDSVKEMAAYTSPTTKVYVSKLKSTAFKWNQMRNTYTEKDNAPAVAELMRYCGQAIKSDYSRLSTGAYTADIALALFKNFGYDAALNVRQLYYYNISDWEEMVYNELKENRPVYHTGYSMGGGHAFVCDGYDGNGMFHFNWGWGGSFDGYFKLVLMNPGTGGIGSGTADGYSNSQEIIIGIQPPTGKKPAKYFMPHSEQFNGTTIYSYFLNTYPENLTCYVGFGLVDEEGNFLRILKDCGKKTLQAAMANQDWIGVNLASDVTLSAGTHRIATVCRSVTSAKWKRVGDTQKYFEVEVDANRQIKKITQHPVREYAITDVSCISNMVAGSKQTVQVSVENKADEVNSMLYLFVSQTEVKGKYQSFAPVLLKKGELTDYYLTFTPESAGTYNLWLSDKNDGSTHLYKQTIQVKTAPVKPSNLQLTKCTIDKEEVSAVIRIKNLSTEPYYRDIVVMFLENLYNDGYLYQTEIQYLPGDIEASKYKDFDVKFKGARSNNQCAIYVGYYKNHTDVNYTQLGGYQHFVTGETPVESIDETLHSEGALYRLDGTKITTPQRSGIYIIDGKKVIKAGSIN